MDKRPSALDWASDKMRRARAQYAAALVRQKLAPSDLAARERLEEAAGAAHEAWGDYLEAMTAAQAPIRAKIDNLGLGRLGLEDKEAE